MSSGTLNLMKMRLSTQPVCTSILGYIISKLTYLGPSCRASISGAKLFTLSAFEPTDEEVKLSISTERDIEEGASSKKKGKGRANSPRGACFVYQITPVDAVVGEYFASDDSDDDMSDFIVQSDEDEEEKDARRELKKQMLADTQSADISDSDDDLDLPDFQHVVFGRAKQKEDTTPEVVNTMPRFLPSTKMKVNLSTQ